jgi:probable O-glycosylation ligase (exosortase A-associated)
MPDRWHERIESIGAYDQDTSALGRFNAWAMAFNLANDRPLIGGGFEIYNLRVFAEYAPDPTAVHSAHSIYFQVLGEHGYVGLLLYLLMWFLVWRDGSWIIRHTQGRDDLRWAHDLARMIHVSLVGYALGGAFLNLAYYDVPYYLITAVVLTRVLVEKSLQDAVPAPEGAPQPQADVATAGTWGISTSTFTGPEAGRR